MTGRSSKLIADNIELEVQGLQYRRNSSKSKLDGLVDSTLKKETEEEGSYVPYAPDGGYGWTIVLASFFSNFVLDGISVTGGALQIPIQIASGRWEREGFNKSGDVEEGSKEDEDKWDYEISVASYSAIGSILLSVTLLVGPLISVMTNRFGFRAVGMAGSIVAAFGIFMSWACSPSIPNIWVMLFFYGFVGGLGFGMMFQPSVIIVGMWFEKRRALATGIAICGTGVGSILFPMMAEFMANWLGWQAAILSQAAIALASTGFAYFYRPLPIKFVKAGVRRTSVAIPVEVPVASPWLAMKRTFLEMLPLCKSPTFLILAIAGAITMLGFYAPYAFIPARAVEDFKMTEREGVWALSAIGVSNTLGRLFFGYISDHPKMNTLVLNNVALTLGGIVTMLSPFLDQPYQLFLYALCFGLMIAIFAVLRSILILKFMGMENFNNAFGLALLFMGVMVAIGNPIGGYLKDQTRNYDYSFYVAGAYFIISGVLCYPLQCVSDWEKRGLDRTDTKSVNAKEKHVERI